MKTVTNNFWWVIILFPLSLITLSLSIYFITLSYFAISFKKNKNFPVKRNTQLSAINAKRDLLKSIFPKIIPTYDFNYLRYAKVYERFYKSRRRIHNELGVLLTPKSDNQLEEGIIKDLIYCTDHNINVNDLKIKKFSLAKAFLILSLLFNFSLLCSVIFPNSISDKKKDQQEIKIRDTLEIKIIDTSRT